MVSASRLCGQVAQSEVNSAGSAIETQWQVGGFANGQQGIRPFLGHRVMRFVDPGVWIIQVEDRFDFDIRAAGRIRVSYTDWTIGAIFANQGIVAHTI